MKRKFVSLLTLGFLMTLSACGETTGSSTTSTDSSTTSTSSTADIKLNNTAVSLWEWLANI